MLNILKEMLRQTVHDRLLWIGTGYIVLMSAVMLFSEGGMTQTGSEAAGTFGMWLMIGAPLIAGTAGARICGADLRDKTANYEILFGKKRGQVYFGRMFAALIAAVVFTVVLTAIPMVFFTVRNGWGGTIAASNALAHFGMMLVMMLRIVFFAGALAFLLGNDMLPFAVMLVGTFLLLTAQAMLQSEGIELTWFTGATDIFHLLDFSNTTDGMLEEVSITVIKAELPLQTALRMLGTSLGFGLTWLLGGLALFRRRDIS